MKLFHLERRQEIGLDLEQVFAFFADPHNLERITPPWLRFRILDCSDDEVREGTEIRYRLRLHGIQLGWTSRISLWEPPFRFVDEQLRGPYRRWHHTHSFERTSSGTLMRDRVEYGLWGGALVNRLLVRRDIEGIFRYRSEALEEHLIGSSGEVAVCNVESRGRR